MPAIRRVTPDPLVYERQGDTSVLRPQAAPVDTFVRPAEPQKSDATALAETLASVRPQINKFLNDKADDIAYDDAREAETKAMVSTAKTWDEAIAKGEVSAGASPLYQRVYEETLGKLHGMNEAQAKLWQDWVSPDNKIRNTQNPQEIAQWFAGKRQELLAGQSVDFQKGLAPMLNQVQQQLTQRIIADNIKAIEQGNHDALGQLFMDRIAQGRKAGWSPAQIAAQLADDALPQRFAGMQGKEINQIAAKAIIGSAQAFKDPNILQVGYSDRPDIRNPGQTIRGVFSIPDFAGAAESARTSILQHQYTQEARADAAQARADRKVAAQTLGGWVAKLTEDPNWEPSADDIRAAVKANPEIMSHWRTQQKAMKEPKATPDLNALNDLTPKFLDAVREGRDVGPIVTSMIATNSLTSAQVLALHKQADRYANSEDNILKSRAYGVADDTIKGALDPLSRKLDPLGAALEVGKARSELYRFATDFQLQALKNGKFDGDAFSRAVETKAAELVQRMGTTSPSAPAPMPVDPTQSAPTPPTQQQGAAPAAPGPTSIGSNIQLAPIAAEAAQMRWPAAPQGAQWSPKPGVQIDIAEINALRSQPLVKNAQGTALWQAFEQKYGPGSVAFFMSPNQNTILQRLQKPGGSSK